ncbi:complex III assembly factor LYRM7 [Dendroctonus ponderosae]
MSNSLRREVLQSFKALHKTRQTVFKGDTFALKEGRKKINEEYQKCKNVENTGSIEELVNYARAVEHELRTCVIQAREVEPGFYQAEIRSDTVKLDNTPFNEAACLNSEKKKTSPGSRCSS